VLEFSKRRKKVMNRQPLQAIDINVHIAPPSKPSRPPTSSDVAEHAKYAIACCRREGICDEQVTAAWVAQFETTQQYIHRDQPAERRRGRELPGDPEEPSRRRARFEEPEDPEELTQPPRHRTRSEDQRQEHREAHQGQEEVGQAANLAINALNFRFGQIVDKLDIMTDDITNIRGDITNIRGDITNIRGDITNIRGDITNIRGDITNLKHSQYNSTALNNVDPIRLLNYGNDVIPAGFPTTVGELKGLTGTSMASIEDYYRLGHHGTVAVRKNRIRRHLGIGAIGACS
jgi:hypothetical protein